MTWVHSTADTPEVRALEENCWTMWRIFGRGPQSRLIDTPDCLAYETPVAQVPYNAVLRFRPGSGDVDRAIAEILAPYRKRDVPVAWLVHPTSSPADLRERLGRQGLAFAEEILGMTRALDDLPPLPDPGAGTEVFRGTGGNQDDWMQLVSWRYELPPSAAGYLSAVYRTAIESSVPGQSTTWWGARRGGETLSKVVLHVGAGVAGIYGVATKPEGRGQGLARLLILTALHEARRAGLGLAVLHSTPMAVGLYERLGFRRVAPFDIWAEPGRVRV